MYSLLEVFTNLVGYPIWKHADDDKKTPEIMQQIVEDKINQMSNYEFLEHLSMAQEERELAAK